MNCRQALKHLYEVIDKEASEIDAREVEKHLKMCRHCMAQYEFERSLKAFVQDKGANQEDVTSLKHSLLEKLDSIDAAGEVGSSKTPFRWHVVAIATAAVVVLCVIAAISLTGLNGTKADKPADPPITVAENSLGDIPYFISARENHDNGLADAVDDSNPLDYLYRQTGIRINPSAKFPVESIQSVSIDTIMGIPFGCIEMLDHNDKLVTLFVTTADKYNLPDNPTAMVDGREMVVHRCQQCTLVGMEKKDLIFMVVSDPTCEPKELVEMASFF